MKKVVFLNKQNKRQRKEYYKKYRNTWGTINPITRKKESKKLYNRHKGIIKDE